MAKLYSLTFLLTLVFVFPALSQNNVGIGTSTPQEKLEVSGAIKIGNTTSNHVGTIRYNSPYFEGRNDTGWIQIGGGADNDWIIVGDNMYAGVDGYAGIGISTPGAKLHVVTDSILSIVGVSFEPDKGIGVIGIGNGKSPVFPGGGAGGVFIGHYGVYAFTDDSLGTGIYAKNSKGQTAGTFVGNIDVQGAIRNTDTTKFGGSVAINDGLTVGDIAGSSCNPVNAASKYFGDTIPPVNGVFPYWSGASPNFNANITTASGQCRSITNVRLETTFFDGNWPINVDIYLRNEYMGKILLSKANVYHSANTQPPPSNFIKQDTADGGYYSNWFFNLPATSSFMGTSPIANWFVRFQNYGADSDYMHSFRLFIDYKWGDSTSAPLYAAYGDIRATGTIYANSNHDVGDVAEFFRVKEIDRKPEVGDIVSISIDNPQTFNLSQASYDPLIAGVISENPSVFLNNPEAGEPIALTGRVKVKVNMEGGKIKPGDPITSSSEIGIGMKANQSSMILGHALEFFDGSNGNGKVWILLAKGHFEKIDRRVQIVQGNDVDVSGLEIKGAKRVKADEKEVFVAWTEKSNVKMPDDIEFDDLVVDITPFGGNADMHVVMVNNEGFTVSVSNASSGFKGFYYKVNMVSAKFYQMNVSLQEDQPNSQSSPELFAQKMAMCEQLEQLTGKSLRIIPQGLSLREIGKYKSSVVESWRKAAPELYSKFESIPESRP